MTLKWPAKGGAGDREPSLAPSSASSVSPVPLPPAALAAASQTDVAAVQADTAKIQQTRPLKSALRDRHRQTQGPTRRVSWSHELVATGEINSECSLEASVTTDDAAAGSKPQDEAGPEVKLIILCVCFFS